MRSVNIFKSTSPSSPSYPIRIEFWEDDLLVRVVECATIHIQAEIANFIMGK